MSLFQEKTEKYNCKIASLLFKNIYEQTNRLDIAINALLVYSNIRDAFLIQSIDYDENENGALTRGPITSNIIESLEYCLKIIPTKAQGFLVVKQDSSISEDDVYNYSDADIGNILGYPCSGDLYKIDNDRFYYSIKANYDDVTEHLLGYICSSDKKEETENLVKNIKLCVEQLKPKYDINIFIEERFQRSLYSICQDIQHNIPLDDIEKNIVVDYLENAGLFKIVELHTNGDIDIFSNNVLLSMIYFCDSYPNVYYIKSEFANIVDENIYKYEINILKSYFNIVI